MENTPTKLHGYPSAFRALRNPQFRALWIAFLVSSVGTWMQIVAQSLLILRLAHGSALALGCVSLSQAAAFFLFALPGGGIADRIDRRRLLIATQTSLMLVAVLLGFLTYTSMVTVPIVAGLAFLSGMILSVDQPARGALVSALVPHSELLGAISLQSAVFNGAAIVGPALAGILVPAVGVAAVFFLNGVSFIGMLAALASLPRGLNPPRPRERLLSQIEEGLRSVHGDPTLVSALAIYGMLLFAGPSLQLLLPVLALDRLHVGAASLGLLFSAAGSGSVLGALLSGSLPAPTMRGIRAAAVCWCAALAVAGAGVTVAVTFAALVVLGTSQTVVAAATSALLQSRVPAQQRGRVMSLNTLLLMGVRPLGDFPASALIAAAGPPFAAIASAGAVAAVALFAGRHSRGSKL